MISLSTQSLYFIAFLILAPITLRFAGNNRKYVFLVLNLAVYFSVISNPAYFVVAAVWILVPYFSAVYLFDKAKYLKSILIIVMVIVFAYLMQYDSIFNTLHIPYVFVFKILGLSYFLFREIDFIMQYDYFKENSIRISLIDYLNYILSFYTLLAGPITRYEGFVTDFYSDIDPLSKDEVLVLFNRIINGYIKVYVISAILSFYAQKWFHEIGSHSSLVLEIGGFIIFAVLNGWFIYFNFSGYCDIVIGFAKMAGLTVNENFNQPYLARSVVEFWNRHHITLSEWIRDYIFSPLFKSLISGPCAKNVKLGQYIALFVTFTIAGVWHGTDLNYLTYGLFQGLGIVVATIWKDKRKKLLGKERNKAYEKSSIAIWVGRCVTWTYICLTFSFVGYDIIGLIIK